MITMKAQDRKIIPGVGAGELRFGVTEDQVQAAIGSPSKIDVKSMDRLPAWLDVCIVLFAEWATQDRFPLWSAN